MRKRIVFRDPQNRCFGCGPHNPNGLRLEFYETDDGVEVEYAAPAHLRGAEGVIHGGIQATLLDETLCMTAYAKLGQPVVTGELTIRYVRPAPTESPLLARARIIKTEDRSVFIEGTINLAASGAELTRAHGRFFFAPTDPARG